MRIRPALIAVSMMLLLSGCATSPLASVASDAAVPDGDDRVMASSGLTKQAKTITETEYQSAVDGAATDFYDNAGDRAVHVSRMDISDMEKTAPLIRSRDYIMNPDGSLVGTRTVRVEQNKQRTEKFACTADNQCFLQRKGVWEKQTPFTFGDLYVGSLNGLLGQFAASGTDNWMVDYFLDEGRWAMTMTNEDANVVTIVSNKPDRYEANLSIWSPGGGDRSDGVVIAKYTDPAPLPTDLPVTVETPVK